MKSLDNTHGTTPFSEKRIRGQWNVRVRLKNALKMKDPGDIARRFFEKDPPRIWRLPSVQIAVKKGIDRAGAAIQTGKRM
jgi:hypothetical protein